MKKILLLCILIAAIASPAQQTVKKDSGTITVSGAAVGVAGGAFQLNNDLGMVTNGFEVIVTGTPATLSVVTKGCMRGGTCDTLDTYTTVANANRKPTIAVAYDYFEISASWTGGSSPTVRVNRTATLARNGGSGGGGGAVSSVFGQTGVVPDLSGDASTSGSSGVTLATVATPGTNTKVTYNAKGLITSGVAAACADLSNAAASCSTDATNATNISSGTLNASRLPNPSATTLGGVQSLAVSASKWLNTISTAGVPSSTQPAFTDISGSVAASQMPALTGDITSSAGTVATTLASVATPGTSLKVTYNAKGLVTSGATAASTDLSDGAGLATKSGIQNTSYSAAADTGAADAYAMCPSPSVSSYATNQEFVFKALNANLTTTPTLNVCALGTKTITKQGTSALAANDIKANCVVTVFYDGTQMQLTSPVCQSSAGVTSIDQLSAAAASKTFADANFLLTFNNAQTTDSQAAVTFGETSAATGGTLTNALANQSELKASTASASTASPLSVVQGSITGTVAFPAAQIQTTWNNASLVGEGIVENVTDTSSNASSLLLDLRKGNTTQFKVDKSGAATAASFASSGSTAAVSDFAQGPTNAGSAPCTIANSICEQAPTSVTSYVWILPTAAASGIPTWTNAANVVTETITATSGSGNVAMTTSPVFTTPTLGAAVGTSLNLGATGVLSTTATSGSGSLAMTTSPVLITPTLGAALGTSLNLGSTGVLSTTATSGSGSLAMTTSPVLVTPTLGAAIGTSLNLGATGVLSTTAQSGTGSIAMTNSPALVTPTLGAALGTSLNLGSTGVLSTTATSGSGNLCLATSCAMTTPKATVIQDANAAPFIASSATASAVDSITVTNAATANPATVTISGSGSDTNINTAISAKGSGIVQASTFSQSPSNRVIMTADWTCGTAGTSTACTSATIVGTNGTPLTLTLPLQLLSWHLHCEGVVGQATAVTANQWNLLTATNGATNVTASYVMGTAATATAWGAITDQASTTTTFQIAPSWTLGGVATKMPFKIDASIEGAAAAGTVISLQLLAPTAADVVTVYRGAYCSVGTF